MLHTAFRTTLPDAPPPPAADAVTLVATARGALDREATGVVRTCLDQLAGLLATHRTGRHPARIAMAPPPAIRGGLAPWQVRRVCALVEDELGTMITVEAMATAAQLSTAHFCRAFKSSTGHTPHAYLMHRRVLRAQALMLHTDDPLSAIACACGLADQSHLARLFRRLVGESPRAWRRRAQTGR